MLPTQSISESTLRMLYDTFSCTILNANSNTILTFNLEGLVFLTYENGHSIHCILEPFEPYDELIYLSGLDRLVFVRFDNGVHLTFVRPNLEKQLFELDGQCSVPDFPGLEGLTGHQDELIAFTDAPYPSVLRIRLSQDQDGGQWVAGVTSRPQAAVPGTLIAVLESTIVTQQDITPLDPIIAVFNSLGQILFKAASPIFTVLDEDIFIASNFQDPPTIQHWSYQDGVTVYHAPGQIIGFSTFKKRICVTTVYKGEETVYEILWNSSLKFLPLWKGSGRKQVCGTPEGFVGLGRDTLSGVSLRRLSRSSEAIPRPLVDWPSTTTSVSHFFSPQDAHAIVFSPCIGAPIGQILHLHGGPDAYEVEELRFFGALRTLLDLGIEVVCLNYRGSTGMGNAAQTAAWGHWHNSFPEDLKWLQIEGLLRPGRNTVTAGWSFGGALAFIAAQHLSEAKGTILGGALTHLYAHRTRAVLADKNYQHWFNDRFGKEGQNEDCMDFFSLQQHCVRPLSVLSFHGASDPHCSYTDLNALRLSASSIGFDWIHHDLPGGQHYASCFEDAKIIYSETLQFLSRIFFNTGILPHMEVDMGSKK